MEQVGDGEPHEPGPDAARAEATIAQPAGAAEPEEATIAEPAEAVGPNEPPAARVAAGSTGGAVLAVVAVVAIVGLGAWLIGRGDEGGIGSGTGVDGVSTNTTVAVGAVEPGVPDTAVTPVSSLPPPSSRPLGSATPSVATPSVAPPPPTVSSSASSASAAMSTTSSPSTAAASAVPRTDPSTPPSGLDTAAPSTVPGGDRPTVVEIVPDIVAFADLLDASSKDAEIARLLAARRHDVASAAPVATICAIVVLDGPVDLSGRWERNGRSIATTDTTARGAPGFGDCVDDDGEPMEDGAYQYITIDDDDTEGAAATFVVGAERMDQRFRNNGDDTICRVLVSPTSARYYEAFVFSADPIRPGDTVTIALADVRQDVATRPCSGDEPLSDFEFDPSPGSEQVLAP